MPLFIFPSSLNKTQHGTSSLENTVAIMVFLLLALATYESTHWLLLRQALNTALLDTARIAATQQAHPQIINEAFAATIKKLPAFALNTTIENWHIEKIKAAPATANTIDNNYQALQYLQGNTRVFEDNTLHLRLHYLHRPATPIVRTVIYAYAQGYVPIVTDVKVAMQSSQPVWKKAEVSSPPSWLPPASNTPSEPLPEPPAQSLPPWAQPPPPSHWQPPGSGSSAGNTPPTLDNCDSDFCCAP